MDWATFICKILLIFLLSSGSSVITYGFMLGGSQPLLMLLGGGLFWLGVKFLFWGLSVVNYQRER